MSQYLENLRRLGKTPIALGQGRVQVVPFTGRVIGLYPEPELNTLWVNPALEERAGADRLINGGGWTNLGGDRTWVSPETELFTQDLSRPLENYLVPKCFDPGDYQVTAQSAEAVELSNRFRLSFYRSQAQVELLIRKRVTVLEQPDFELPPGVSAAGYRLDCTLEGGAEAIRLHPALWNLLQVPGNGRILVPVRGNYPEIACFGPQLQRRDAACVTAEVPVATEGYKFGILPAACTGLTFYLRDGGARSSLIVRSFVPGRADRYYDVPLSDPSQPACVQQIYVDNGSFGNFGELEHHSEGMTTAAHVADRCTTWAFTGTPEELARIVDALMPR